MSDNVSEGPRIVVGVDGSADSRLALRWAMRLARAEGASIDAVGAWQYPTGLAWTAVPEDYSPKQDLEKAVEAAVDDVFGQDRPDSVRVLIGEGHPVRVLLDASEGALMLVVGSRGHGGFSGLLMGSVSARVAELANCPVLVVHEPPEP
jgi:nucleotide-binding universal stress UspA family protein